MARGHANPPMRVGAIFLSRINVKSCQQNIRFH
jgi:hypothetical protein